MAQVQPSGDQLPRRGSQRGRKTSFLEFLMFVIGDWPKTLRCAFLLSVAVAPIVIVALALLPMRVDFAPTTQLAQSAITTDHGSLSLTPITVVFGVGGASTCGAIIVGVAKAVRRRKKQRGIEQGTQSAPNA
jgi:hypothetical protein